MQAINRVIVRPVFLMVFLGTGVTCVLALITGWQDLGHRSRIWGISGAIVYLLGSVGVTIAFNVPLNNRLDRVDADSEQGASMWETYFVRWTRWNHVRSIATIASTALLILAVYYAN